MKKLCRRRGTVHPSPPLISDHLSFLPAAILTLAAALSPGDREVLAYLVSSAVNNFSCKHKPAGGTEHSPANFCGCFRCYTSYWIRWDSSPNRQIIHEIIDAYEEQLSKTLTGKNNKKERKKKLIGSVQGKESEPISNEEESRLTTEMEAAGEGGGGGGGEEEAEKGFVRKILSFIGERIWGGWINGR